MQLSDPQLRELQAQGARVVSFRVGHDYQALAEALLFGTPGVASPFFQYVRAHRCPAGTGPLRY
jgi:hypothetical protein